MNRLFRLTLLFCTRALLPVGQQPLLAQPAPGAVTPAAPPQPQPEVQALIEQGRAALTARKFDESLRLFEQTLARARALQDRVGEGTALNGIGACYSNLNFLIPGSKASSLIAPTVYRGSSVHIGTRDPCRSRFLQDPGELECILEQVARPRRTSRSHDNAGRREVGRLETQAPGAQERLGVWVLAMASPTRRV